MYALSSHIVCLLVAQFGPDSGFPADPPSPNTLNEPRREKQQLRHGDTGGILPDTRKHCCTQIMMFMLRLCFLQAGL